MSAEATKLFATKEVAALAESGPTVTALERSKEVAVLAVTPPAKFVAAEALRTLASVVIAPLKVAPVKVVVPVAA